MKTLLLTPWMTPHNIVPWQTAVTLMFLGKVEILEEYDEEIRSPSVSLRAPAVARLTKPVGMIKRGVKFSRINVFTRDNFRCQYCGTRKSMRELNYDHVIPRTQRGLTVWDNIVTCCYPCNERKSGRTPDQAGMKLLRAPYRPKSLPISHLYLEAHQVPPEWNGYCSPASDGGDAVLLATGLASLTPGPSPASWRGERPRRGGPGLEAVVAFPLTTELTGDFYETHQSVAQR